MTIRLETSDTNRPRVGDVALGAILVLCILVVAACTLCLHVAFIRWACR